MEKILLVVKHVEQEGPGYIGDLFAADGWAIETVELSGAAVLPRSLEGIGGVVILGGPMNVYEEEAYPFLKDEESFIRRALIDEVPILGICLGAQLLAKTCGARIIRSPQKEIGWSTVTKTFYGMEDSLFRGNPQRMTVFQWHGDTFGLPDEGVLLAKGRICKNQAFRVGHNAYGLQFHIESTPEMIEAWMREERGVDVKRIINTGSEIIESFTEQGKRIVTNFKRIVEISLQYRRTIARFINENTLPEEQREGWWKRCER